MGAKDPLYGLNWAAIVCPFLLPVSFLWDLVSYWSLLASYWLERGVFTHEDKVRGVQDQVRKRDGRKMCTARPSWMSISQQRLGYKDRMCRVRLDALRSIVRVDREEMTVSVEPNITIGFLNRALVTQGLTLPVVPELDNLTIGGLINGGGIESTSHKYGLFHHIATEYEVVLASGEVIRASLTENEEYFHAIPMSYGTLGFVTLVRLRVVEHKPYIRLTYTPCRSLDQTIATFSAQTMKDTDNDSVEGIAFSRDTSVIMTGQFVTKDEVDWTRYNPIGRWYKPWFYQHVRSFLESGDDKEHVEFVPTLDFHQRHNKPCFWMSHIWLPWADKPLARLLTGWLLPMNYQLLQWLKETFIGDDFEDNLMLQDFILPINHIKESLILNDSLTNIYPVWLVPARLYLPHVPESLLPSGGDVIYVDVGVYGHSKLPNFMGRERALKTFEKFTLEHQGYQALYAETLLSYEEFVTMFPREQYDLARNKYPGTMDAYPEVFEKVSKIGRERKHTKYS